jgi:hypothetical protein
MSADLKKVLLIECNKDHADEIQKEIDQLFETVWVSDLDHAEEILTKDTFSYVLYKIEEPMDAGFVDTQHALYPDLKFIILVRNQFHNYLEVFTQRPYLKNFVSCLPEITSSDISAVLKKIHNKDIFGFKHYFKDDSNKMSVTVSDSHEKSGYIDQCMDFLNECNLSSTIKARIGNVFEELMMNILWDAPHDEDGNPIHNNKSRHEHIVLTPEQAGKVEVTYDESHICVSASDPFGAIRLEKILSYLTKCFYGEEQIGSEDSKGAGLGLYMIYKISNNFTINVSKGKKTEFLLLFKSKHSKKVGGAEKSFHYYEV